MFMLPLLAGSPRARSPPRQPRRAADRPAPYLAMGALSCDINYKRRDGLRCSAQERGGGRRWRSGALRFFLRSSARLCSAQLCARPFWGRQTFGARSPLLSGAAGWPLRARVTCGAKHGRRWRAAAAAAASADGQDARACEPSQRAQTRATLFTQTSPSSNRPIWAPCYLWRQPGILGAAGENWRAARPTMRPQMI